MNGLRRLTLLLLLTVLFLGSCVFDQSPFAKPRCPQDRDGAGSEWDGSVRQVCNENQRRLCVRFDDLHDREWVEDQFPEEDWTVPSCYPQHPYSSASDERGGWIVEVGDDDCCGEGMAFFEARDDVIDVELVSPDAFQHCNCSDPMYD